MLLQELGLYTPDGTCDIFTITYIKGIKGKDLQDDALAAVAMVAAVTDCHAVTCPFPCCIWAVPSIRLHAPCLFIRNCHIVVLPFRFNTCHALTGVLLALRNHCASLRQDSPPIVSKPTHPVTRHAVNEPRATSLAAA
jgi:hypothetical protein